MKATSGWKVVDHTWPAAADPKDFQIREVREELDRLQAQLDAGYLGSLELKELLQRLGNVTSSRLNSPVKVNGHGTGSLPAEVQRSLYALCKEVLVVIIGRARAHQVSLQIIQTPVSTSIHIHQEGDLFEIEREKAERFDNFLNAALGAERFGITVEVKNKDGPSSEVILRWHPAG